MNDGKQTWICPRKECRELVSAYTDGSLKALIEAHISKHQRDDRTAEAKRRFVESSIGLVRPRDYGILRLSPTDLGFLKTRHIKIDDAITVDLTSEPRPSTTELRQELWARILDAAWSIPGGENGIK